MGKSRRHSKYRESRLARMKHGDIIDEMSRLHGVFKEHWDRTWKILKQRGDESAKLSDTQAIIVLRDMDVISDVGKEICETSKAGLALLEKELDVQLDIPEAPSEHLIFTKTPS